MICSPEFLAARHLAAEAIYDLHATKPSPLRVLKNGRVELRSDGQYMARDATRPKLQFAVSVATLLILKRVDCEEVHFVDEPLAEIGADRQSRKALNMAEIHIDLRHGEKLQSSFDELSSLYEDEYFESDESE